MPARSMAAPASQRRRGPTDDFAEVIRHAIFAEAVPTGARPATTPAKAGTSPAPALDDYIERIIVARLQRPDATEVFTPPTGTDLDTSALHTEAAAIGQRLTDLSGAFAEGAITVVQFRTGTGKLRDRLTEIDDTLAAAAKVNPLVGLAGQPHIADIWYGTAPDRSDGLDLGRRRAVLAKLLTVTVLSTSRGRRPDGSYFDPTGIHIAWKTH
jgi:site-specific DNA recombinase